MTTARGTAADFQADVIVIGTGMGGGTLAYGLAGSDASVLLIERGDFLPQEPANWDPAEVFLTGPVQERGEVVRRRRLHVLARHLLLRRREHQVLRRLAPPVSPGGLRGDRACRGHLARVAVRV